MRDYGVDHAVESSPGPAAVDTRSAYDRERESFSPGGELKGFNRYGGRNGGVQVDYRELDRIVRIRQQPCTPRARHRLTPSSSALWGVAQHSRCSL